MLARLRILATPRLPVLPRRCLVCGLWGTGTPCTACRIRLLPPTPRCPACALPQPAGRLCGQCLHQRPVFATTCTAVDYTHPWDGLVARFKFQQQPELAGPLAALLAQALPAPAAGYGGPTLVLPVPLSTQRLAERGYNQAWELARRVASRHGLPARHDLLLRLRDTGHQVGLTRRERQHNLREAFWVPPPAAALLNGRTVALVDDVMTTGVTAGAATEALLRAGAAQVQVWVLARTPAPAPAVQG